MSSPSVIETVIKPNKGFRALNWRELWAYRDLRWLLVWGELECGYKQTVLGPLWFIIQPLLTTIVFTIIFSWVGQIHTAGVPPMLFYLGGLLAWNYFSLSFQSTSSTLVNNAGLFGKVYFPRLVVPVSAVISNLIAFAIQLVTFAVFFVIYKQQDAASTFNLQWTVIFLPMLVLQLAALSLGLGLWLSALTAKYRDFTIVSGFIIQLWLYATPVIYPLSRIPERWRLLVALNPMTMPVECFREILLGAGQPTVGLVVLSIVVTVLTLIAGLMIFQRAEKSFVDVL